MSYLITASSVPDAIIWVDPDDRLMKENLPYRYNRYNKDLWWGSSSLLGGSGWAPRPEFERTPKFNGMRADKSITGITYSSAGVALANVTVKAFRTSDDLPNGFYADTIEGPTVVSGTDGSYELSVPNSDAHYLVAYKTGSPDVEGSTVNTVTGA